MCQKQKTDSIELIFQVAMSKWVYQIWLGGANVCYCFEEVVGHLFNKKTGFPSICFGLLFFCRNDSIQFSSDCSINTTIFSSTSLNRIFLQLIWLICRLFLPLLLVSPQKCFFLQSHSDHWKLYGCRRINSKEHVMLITWWPLSQF